MADQVYMGDPWANLSIEHGQLSQNQNAIRHDVASGFADTRHDIVSATGDVRRDVNNNAADIRREGAVERGEIRYDVATRAGDIRREQEAGFGGIRYAIAEHSEDTNRDVLTSGYQTRDKVDSVGDAILQRSADFFIAEQSRDFDMGRDLSDLKATVLMGNQKTAGDIALAQAQTGKEILESRLEITNLSRDLARQIGAENEKTRDLIHTLKNDELNRLLIERNTDLTHCRHDYWGARDGLFNTQFAALSSQVNSQLNALNSQVAETRQGLVNFGTMAGNAGQQSSTSNQVR
jgi:hypothetical protein